MAQNSHNWTDMVFISVGLQGSSGKQLLINPYWTHDEWELLICVCFIITEYIFIGLFYNDQQQDGPALVATLRVGHAEPRAELGN